MIAVRAVRAGEHEPLRDVRLAALAQAPSAFAATVEEESAYPESRWVQLAASGQEADELFVCVAIDDERWIGMAAGRWLDRDRGVVQLWGMWVSPERRGQGIGGRLVAAVREWAAARGARFVRLGVIGEDAPARAFYERLGFVDTGERKPLTRDPSLIAVYMARPA